jgi:hypothetical protein
MQALHQRPTKLHRGAWQAQIETRIELILVTILPICGLQPAGFSDDFAEAST